MATRRDIMRAAAFGGILEPLLRGTARAAAPEPKRGGSVVFTLGADPGGFNRNISSVPDDGMVASAVYEGLVQVTGTGEIKPLLAKSWTISGDGLTYSFDLQKASWHDGKPFTSDDVKYTFLEVSAKYSAIFSSAGQSIDTIDTPAPDRVVIKLKQPYGPFMISLPLLQGGGILPAHIYRSTDVFKNPANWAPVGTGPYMLKAWNHGSDVQLVRNPNYWDKGKPYLDEVIGRVIPQASSRTQALMSGEVDFVSYYYLPSNDYAVLRAQPQLTLAPSKVAPAIGFLIMNVTRPVLADKRVRQALFMATDRDYLLKSAFQGAGSVGTMPFTNRIKWAANPAIDYRKMYPFDMAKANALLDAAGKPRGADGTRFSLNFVFDSSDPNSALVATALKYMWHQVGINLDILALDPTAAKARVFTARDFDVSITSYSSAGDPALGMARAFVTSSIGKAYGNASGYSNPVVDDLFKKAEHASTQEARGKYYQQAQAILADDLPILTLREVVLFDGMSKSLHGMKDEAFFFSWRAAWRDS